MGCSGSRGKNANQDNLFINLVEGLDLQLKKVDKNVVHFFMVEIDGQQIRTKRVEDLKGIDTWTRLPLETIEGEMKLRVELREGSQSEYDQWYREDQIKQMKIKMGEEPAEENKLVKQLTKEQGDVVLVMVGSIDAQGVVGSPLEWKMGQVEMINGAGNVKFMGAIKYRLAFFPTWPGDPNVQTQISQLANDNTTYKIRDFGQLVDNHQLNTLEWPHRRGNLTVMIQAMKLNDLALKYACKTLVGQLEVMGESLPVDDIRGLIVRNQQSFKIPLSFDPIRLNSKGKLCLYVEEIKHQNRVASFGFDIEGLVKKHGQWGLGGTYKAYDAELDGTSHPVVKTYGMFQYESQDYSQIYNPPPLQTLKTVSGVQTKGMLVVHVLRGKNLLACDENGLSDPFVEFYTAAKFQDKQFTQVVEKNLNPEWLTRRKFNLKQNQSVPSKLYFKVWDRDPVGQDLIGEVELDLSALIKNSKWIDGWQKIVNPAKQQLQCGQIYVQVGYMPEGTKVMAKRPIAKY